MTLKQTATINSLSLCNSVQDGSDVKQLRARVKELEKSLSHQEDLTAIEIDKGNQLRKMLVRTCSMLVGLKRFDEMDATVRDFYGTYRAAQRKASEASETKEGWKV